MGYNSTKIATQIKKTLDDYRQLQINGDYKEAARLIRQARKAYPNDYDIMSRYMWELAGGSADNDPKTLNAHYDEFMQICDCILRGCTDDKLRLDTIAMKAKLLHASGNTTAALALFSQFPSWYQSSGQKTEQLFAKDTPEFRYWVKRNLYELADFTSNKMIKTVWFEDGILPEERVIRCEKLGDMFRVMREQSDENVFVVFEHASFSELSSKLTSHGGNIGDIIRIHEKCLIAAGILTERAKNDSILREVLINTFKSDNPLAWTIDWLRNTQHIPYTKLRGDSGYMKMLDKYSR